MLKKIKNFVSSFTWHLSRGMPKSSQREINRRFSICEKCQSYNRIKKECDECGCNINRKKIFMNKLAWLDSSCPLSKW